MRAMRTYAKKNECMNAPAGPFTMFSHCAYGYNIRNELISAAKNTERQYQYYELDSLASDDGVSYTYDAAGNRTTKTENGETITYTLGLSDGLASWMSMGSSSMGSCLEAEPGNLTASRNAYTTVEPLDITRRWAKLTRRVLPLDLFEPRRRIPGWKGLSGRGVLTKHPSGRTG